MKGSQLITELDIVKEHLKTYKQKAKADFKWVEKMGEHYYHSYGPKKKYINNIDINANLLKGRGISRENIKDWADILHPDLGIGLNHEELPHHDIIGNIGKSMVGYQRKRAWNPMAIDTGPEEGNARKEAMLEMLQEWIQKRMIPAYQQRAAQNVMNRHRVADPLQLTPEEQRELEFEIQQETEVLTPSRIKDYMRNDFMSPTSKVLNELLQYLSKEYDLKFTTDGNFAISLASGSQIYYTGIRGDQLVFEIVDPRNFLYGDYPTCEWIEDSQWTVYRQELPVIEIIQRYGSELKPADVKKMGDLGTSYQEIIALENARLISEVQDPREFEGINIRTTEGQNKIRRLKNEYGAGVFSNTFEVTHVTFKSVDQAKFVKRELKGGKVRGFYVGSNYEFNPAKGDKEIRDVHVPIAFECTRLQVGDSYVYVGKGPLEHTYRSIENPYKISLPYTGGVYNKMMGMGEPVSQMDLGKPGQLEYNYVKAKMEEDRSTDYGTVLPILESLMPEGYKLSEWLSQIKHDKFLVIGEEAFANNRIDATQLQLIRGIDMGSKDKIASRLAELEAIRISTARQMGFNEAMLGQASPYESIQNNRTNISLSLNQTQDVYSYHDKIVERALTQFIQNALIYYKDKPIQRSYIMSDISVASLDINLDNFPPALAGVFITTSPEDEEKLFMAKQAIQPFIQNQMMDEEDIIRLATAESIGEVYNIARNSKLKRDKAAAVAHQRRMEELNKQEEIMRRQAMEDHEKELAKIDRKNIANLQMAELNAQTLERANDVNRDQINDANERQNKDLIYKREKDALDRHLERQLKELELEAKKIGQG